jgi:hypothetical protein
MRKAVLIVLCLLAAACQQPQTHRGERGGPVILPTLQ